MLRAKTPPGFSFLIEDPDGSADAITEHLTDAFRKPNDPSTPPEVFAYTRYFADFVNTGRTIDVSVSLHNIEADEGENLLCPCTQSKSKQTVIDFNTALFQRAEQEGYITGRPELPWQSGYSFFRLYGWCGLHFGTLPLAFEVNDRYPKNPLSLPRLQHLGALLGASLGQWSASDAGRQWHLTAAQHLRTRQEQRAAYWAKATHGEDQRTKYELLTLGY